MLEADHYFLDGGVGLKSFQMQKFCSYAAPAANNFFVCVRLFFYLHTIYFSIYSLCKRFISKFSNPLPPGQKIMVSPLEMLCDFSGRIMRGFKKACFEPSLQNARPPTFPKKQK